MFLLFNYSLFNYSLCPKCDATKQLGFCRRSSNTAVNIIMKHQQVTNNGPIRHVSIKLRIQLKIVVLFESQILKINLKKNKEQNLPKHWYMKIP